MIGGWSGWRNLFVKNFEDIMNVQGEFGSTMIIVNRW